MRERIIFSGFGGQGILSSGLIIAEAALRCGYESTFFPTYGAEMRGGTANCSVIISDSFICSPMITQADTLIAFNEPSITRFLGKVTEDGLVIINSSIVKKQFDYGSRSVVKIPFDHLALEKLGKVKAANVIMLGVYLNVRKVLNPDEIKQVIRVLFEKKGEEVIALNYKAFELGYSI
jgi:2-oxoglutarate ferredoxin oxidoreductase subunit gamma